MSMVGTMNKSQFDPEKNYNLFYHSHRFEPWPEEHILSADEILPRAAWALDVAQENHYKTFCDVCCLDGFVATTLAFQADMMGVGIDLSEPGINLLEKRAIKNGLPIVAHLGAAEDYENPMGGEFDMIMMFEAVEHFLDTELIINKYKQMLKPGGSILISTPDAEGTFGIGNDDACHVRYYTHKTEAQRGDLMTEWEGRPIPSLPDMITRLGGTVVENDVFNELIHLRATFK